MASRDLLCRLAGDLDDRGVDNARRVARELSLDGQMRTGGPGGAAAQQQADDVAALAIALATHEPPATAARFTRAYAGAVARGGNTLAASDTDCPVFRAIAQRETFGEAAAALVKLAPQFFWANVALFQSLRPEADADAAMAAASKGLVRDIRCTVFRPNGSACIRLVDSTQGSPINRAVAWFDGARAYPAPAKGIGVSGTGEFGFAMLSPLAFAVLGDDRDDDRDQPGVYPRTPTASAGRGFRAQAPAAGAGKIQPEQRSDAARAATFAEASAHDD